MINLARLRGEHAEILALAAKLRQLIGRDQPPPPLHLLALRHELSSLLIGHLKAEDWVLYPPLLNHCEPAVADTARAFCAEMGGMAAAYSEHCTSWTAAAIGADWPGYCQATEALIDALGRRILRENRELYPLLEKLDRAA